MCLMEEEDRISYLPDCLLVEIMSRMKTEGRINERTMTTKEVIRTTITISKRWQHLWTLLPKLIFVDEHDIINNDDDGLTRYASFIDKTLTQSPSFVKLDKFKLYTTFNSRDNPEFKSQVIRWIRHAIIHRNVQKVHFMLWDVGELSKFIFDDVLFFNNTCFRKMKLRECLLNPPNGVIRWEHLEVLHLSKVLSRLESKGFHFFESTDDDDTDSSLSDSSEIVAENAKETAVRLVSEVKTDILAVLDCLEKEREAKMALREELGRAEQNVLNANEKVKMHEQLSASLKKYIIRLLDELREAKRVNNQLESEKAAILQEVSSLRAHNTIHDQPNKRRSRRRM